MAAPRQRRQDSSRRRADIAAAALRVLGEQGPRGFTHRAVDTAANLAPGSVNYHAPTRQRLLEMALDELFAQDMAVAARHFHPGSPTLADIATDFVLELSGPQARFRVVARHHLLAEARVDPELHDRFETQRAAFVRLIADRAADNGHPIGPSAAELCVILIDGLVHRQVFFADSALSHTEIRALIRTTFRLAGPDRE
ncbi:TetR/AcrR family transcriptional regulator [Nocardia nova]|uniref:TetR/AcrR family transcriptional regulator n=1 Tax=Nocardia nova TaxID=37330 RepID=UPI0033F3A959